MSRDTLAALIAIAAGILAILARIFGVFGAIRRWWERKHPVRLKCEDASESDPIAGSRKALRIEAFNRSDSPVQVKAFGLLLRMQEQAVWERYEPVTRHSFPKSLEAHQGLDVEIDKEALGDQPFRQDCTGVHAYVDISGLGKKTIDIGPLPRPTWRLCWREWWSLAWRPWLRVRWARRQTRHRDCGGTLEIHHQPDPGEEG